MELALQEFPLVLFTTLAPIGAGAFVPLFLLFLRSVYKKASTARIDQLTLVPVLFAFIGFICSIFHLGNPFNALNVLNTVGQTPLANEVVAFGVFLVLAIVYWVVVTVVRRIEPIARMIMSGIVMVSGLIAVIFMGMAYAIPSIPVWNSPRSVMEMISIWLFGGVGLGMFLLMMADPRDNNAYADEIISKVILGIGGVLLIVSSLSIFMAGSTMSSALISISGNANSLLLAQNLVQFPAVIAIICAFLGRKHLTRPMFTAVFVLSFIACFFARFCFYGMQISIGF